MSQAHLRTWWPALVLVFLCVGLAGVGGNCFMIHSLVRQTKFRRLVNYLLFNLCISDLLKCILVRSQPVKGCSTKAMMTG